MESTNILPSCTKVPLSSEILLGLIGKAKDWTIMHGMGYRPKTNTDNNILQHAPFTILPSTFPKTEFENACDIQIILNTLIHKVAYDYEFIKETLLETIKVDEFTRKLFEIYETVYNEGINQKISLGLIRSDLMLDTCCSNDESIQSPFCCWKQVEINTIASGMGGLGTVTTEFHKFILNELDMKDSVKYLPENNALEGMTMAMLKAWKIYDNPHAIILFVVEEFALNICDQRFHEFDITKHNVRVMRKTLTQLTIEAKLGPNKELYVNDKIVAVVYYRIGYSPNQYYTQKEWDVRLLIERSLAIKCPSIQYHLAGTKKIQQALARPGVVAQYLDNEKTVERVKKIFTAVPDVIHAVPKYEVGHETREMYFFREGTVVLWNTPELESGNILNFLKSYEDNSYAPTLVHDESEMMSYTYAEIGRQSYLKDGDIYLACNATSLDKYAFSNALSQSVKLSIWEASLDQYIDSIEFVTEDLKSGKKIKMTREQVLRKQGELLALRHVINLSSDLLDTPDFYWEKDDLENIYQQTCSYFSIAKRTRVMNEKINHCVELVELLSSHLSDRHHIRLEWMIIILIIAEVVFEIIHFVDRYLEKSQESNLTYLDFSPDMQYSNLYKVHSV